MGIDEQGQATNDPSLIKPGGHGALLPLGGMDITAGYKDMASPYWLRFSAQRCRAANTWEMWADRETRANRRVPFLYGHQHRSLPAGP